jgi:hypothetical protein
MVGWHLRHVRSLPHGIPPIRVRSNAGWAGKDASRIHYDDEQS